MNSNKIIKNNFSKIFDEAEDLVSDKKSTPIIDSLKSENERYTDFCEHAQGGNKIIYKCHDEYTDRKVALALLKDISDSKKEETFLREGRITSLLQHPNVIPVYDMGFRKNKPFFTMKFIQGKSLGEIIEDLRNGSEPDFTRSQLLDIFLRICDAISYAHSHGIAHLDLKPDNICIDPHGEVYVCDWGLAIILDSSEFADASFPELDKYTLNSIHQDKMTIDGYIKGTPGYMAPEQTGYTKKKKGPHSDIFSLGAILYTILTHRKPFAADSLKQIIQKTIEGDFALPSSFDNDLPSQLELICLKSLSVPLEERYASVEALKNDILAFRNGYAISAEKNSNLKILTLLIKRNKALFSLTTCALIIIITSSLYFTSHLKKSRNEALQIAEKFRLKSEESNSRGHLLSNEIFDNALKYHEKDDFSKALELAEYALQLNSENQLAWKLKAQIQFIQEQYTKAKNSVSKVTQKDPFSTYLNTYLAKNNPPDNINEFLDLFMDLQNTFGIHNRLCSDLLHYKVHSPITWQERIALVTPLLKIFNNDKLIQFTFDQETKHLDFSHNPDLVSPYMLQNSPALTADFSHTKIKDFITFRSMPLLKLDVSHTLIDSLETLELENLRELSIAHTSIRNIEELRGRSLQTLDIRGLELDKTNYLFSLSYLKKLIISANQLDQNTLSTLGKRQVEILVKE